MTTLIILDDDARLGGSLATAAREMVPGLRTVHAATTPRDAAVLLAAAPPDETLILLSDLDLHDPLTDGLSFLAHAARQRPDSVRLLMTGLDPESYEHRVERGILHREIQKPYVLQPLEEALLRH